ncbi:MAG TPA: type II toxin-antitoxin system VapC family toxin, partial [Gammaproteobacteria bacterium]|nr:type II toxin-antitoxin system VapC family toxin [Gammaproteobacteria bacterium]
MNLVDSSGWLEYFADGPNAGFFAPAIEQGDALLVSSIDLYEVFKQILQQRDEDSALKAIAVMGQGRVVPVDDRIALSAVGLSVRHQLPMADSLILASA